jgi:hypothetical protein
MLTIEVMEVAWAALLGEPKSTKYLMKEKGPQEPKREGAAQNMGPNDADVDVGVYMVIPVLEFLGQSLVYDSRGSNGLWRRRW